MSFISIDATQLQQLDRGMSRYRNAVPKSVSNGALRKALRPMFRAAQAEVPVRSGSTRRDLRIKIVKPESEEISRALVGVSQKGDKVGWKTHFITGGTRRMPRNDFLQRAYDQTIAEVSMIYSRELYDRFMEWGRQNLPQGSL